MEILQVMGEMFRQIKMQQLGVNRPEKGRPWGGV